MIKNLAAIVTSDVVNSSDLPKIELQKMMLKSEELLQYKFINKIELYRGDGLQTYVARAKDGLLAMLTQFCFYKRQNIMLRQSLGIGRIAILNEKLAASVGSAFELSGRGLEGMKQEQLLFTVNFEQNKNQKEWTVHNAVLTDLIENWSQAQAEVVLLYLLGQTQNDMAQKLGISQAAVHQRLKSAKVHLLQIFLNRYAQMF